MKSTINRKILFAVLTLLLLNSCFNKNRKQMSLSNNEIISEVKLVYDSITFFAEKAQVDPFLKYYSNSDDFLAFSADGKMRKYDEFKNVCTIYYNSLETQEVTTISEVFHVIHPDLVILGCTGNIHAFFKNGDSMKMKDYSITSVFKKIDNQWKVIHDHESSLPPEINKSKDKK